MGRLQRNLLQNADRATNLLLILPIVNDRYRTHEINCIVEYEENYTRDCISEPSQ